MRNSALEGTRCFTTPGTLLASRYRLTVYCPLTLGTGVPVTSLILRWPSVLRIHCTPSSPDVKDALTLATCARQHADERGAPQSGWRTGVGRARRTVKLVRSTLAHHVQLAAPELLHAHRDGDPELVYDHLGGSNGKQAHTRARHGLELLPDRTDADAKPVCLESTA
jgi:hypothetical protein